MTYHRACHKNRFKKAGREDDLPTDLPTDRQKRDAFLYFYHIDENFGTTHIFKRNWVAFPGIITDPRSLVLALQRTVDWLSEYPDDDKKFAADFLRKNIGIWENEAMLRIEEFNLIDLECAFTALARLGVRLSPDFFDLFEKHSLPELEKFNDKQFFNIIWAFSTLGERPTKKYLDTWENEAVRRIENCDVRGITQILMSYATFGFDTPEWVLKAGTKKAEELIALARIENIATMMHAFAIFDSLKQNPANREITQKLNDHAERFARHAELSERVQKQIYHVCLWFDLKSSTAPSKEETGVGVREDELVGMFRESALPLFNMDIGKMSHKVDVAINPDRPVAIEMDGFSHFVGSRTGGKLQKFYNGHTIFQSALMKKLEPDIRLLRLPYDSMNRVSITDVKKAGEMFSDMYYVMLLQPSGNYMVEAGKNSFCIQPLTSLTPV